MDRVPYMPIKSTDPKLRWRVWYPAIADWMLENPGGKMGDCAHALGKAASTLSIIVNSDLFKEYFAQRRANFTKEHDFAITHKLTMVAEKSLDVMLEKLEAQKDKIPIKNVTELATSALDRLGYAPKTSTQVVNIDNRSQSVVMAPISAEALEEARDALRAVERKKTIEHREREFLSPSTGVVASVDGDAEAEQGEAALGVEAAPSNSAS